MERLLLVLNQMLTSKKGQEMINSNTAPLGMAVTPHHLASESALAVLREGGNAIEAMVAAAATIAVVYPHMNGLGATVSG
ncbi:Oxamate amidohydrolase proenzyme [Serratia plymuthica]|nr:Oxamate amidohydrolase proenzyme [Serratia plymuthica]